MLESMIDDNARIILNRKRVVPVLQVPQLVVVGDVNVRRLGNVKQNTDGPVKLLFERLCDLPNDLLRIIFCNTDDKTRLALRSVQIRINQIVLLDLNVIFKIDIKNLNKVNDLFKLVLNNKLFCSKVQGFDFRKITINDDTSKAINSALNIISQNAYLFPNFTTLIIGDVDVSFNLDMRIDYLTTLSIGKIGEKLETHNDFNFQLSNAFQNLTNLSIEKIGIDAFCTWPVSLESLKCLTICFTNLEQMAGGYLSILNLASNLEVLTIPTFNSDYTFILPDLNQGLGGWQRGTCILPDSLHNLEKLIIHDFESDASLELSGTFNNLTTLSVGHLCKDSTFDLSGTFNNLQTFIVRELEDDEFEFPNLLNELETLILGNIKVAVMEELPEKLPKLKTLIIGDIEGKGCFELIDLPMLETLELGEVLASITLTDLSKLKLIKIEYIDSQGSVILEGSFDSLVRLELEDIDGELTLPSDKFLDCFEDKDQLLKKHQLSMNNGGSVTLTSRILLRDEERRVRNSRKINL